MGACYIESALQALPLLQKDSKELLCVLFCTSDIDEGYSPCFQTGLFPYVVTVINVTVFAVPLSGDF